MCRVTVVPTLIWGTKGYRSGETKDIFFKYKIGTEREVGKMVIPR